MFARTPPALYIYLSLEDAHRGLARDQKSRLLVAAESRVEFVLLKRLGASAKLKRIVSK